MKLNLTIALPLLLNLLIKLMLFKLKEKKLMQNIFLPKLKREMHLPKFTPDGYISKEKVFPKTMMKLLSGLKKQKLITIR